LKEAQILLQVVQVILQVHLLIDQITIEVHLLQVVIPHSIVIQHVEVIIVKAQIAITAHLQALRQVLGQVIAEVVVRQVVALIAVIIHDQILTQEVAVHRQEVIIAVVRQDQVDLLIQHRHRHHVQAHHHQGRVIADNNKIKSNKKGEVINYFALLYCVK